MAQKTLNAFVVIGGRVDNTFGQIGTALINLGSTVDEISQKLIDFGKESLKVYKDYEYNMAELETVWATNGTFVKGSKELIDAMQSMGDAAAQWASNTIFHTNDISNAFVEAAHAGWDFEEMMDGIPAAMAMAQAGGMDLSSALDYVLKAQKDFGWSFDLIDDKLDEWIYAANRSAGTAEEFGDTFLRLGSVVRFGANTEEILALTKVMHDLGTTGSAAGTLIKTSLMRLYAPSGKASKVLKALGASQEDIDSLRENKSLIQALDTLELNGFSAFDPITQQAKPVLQTYSELGKALISISGYSQEAGESQQEFYERVLKHKDVMGVMSEVFGIRGIQGSMNILMSLQEANEMYEELMGGAANGTGEYVAERMMNTLYGDTELLASKVEELHRRLGEELSGDVRAIQTLVGDIVSSISGMDDAKFTALVDGLKVIAASGASLVAAGSLFRFIGMIGTLPGALSLMALAATSAASAMTSLKEAEFEGMFGEMNLDMSTLGEYIKNLGSDFEAAFKNVNDFAGALDTAVQNYRNASGEFSSDILSAMLTKTEFTPEDKARLEQLGINIYEEVLASINASSDMAAEFWKTLYGGEGTAELDPKYQKIIDLLDEGNQATIAQAESVAERLKEAMLKGFEEGFTEDDYNTILGLFEEYNELVARAQNEALTEEQFVQQEKWLHKAQTASLDEIQTLAAEAEAQREQQVSELEDRYLTERARLKYYAKESGMTDEEAEAYIANETDVDSRYAEWRAKSEAYYDEFMTALWSSQIRQSDMGSQYQSLEKYANWVLEGAMSPEKAMDLIRAEMGKSVYAGEGGNPWSAATDRESLGKMMGLMVASMGGEEAIRTRIGYYEQAGNDQAASELKQVLAMEQLVNGFATITSTTRGPIAEFLKMGYDFTTSSTGGVDAMDKYYADEQRKANMEAFEQYIGGAYTTARERAAAEMSPVDVAVEFPEALETAAATHQQIVAEFKPIDQYVNIIAGGTGGSSITALGRFNMKARGGRETTPSIFAEAGIPEWYIPEEHSDNTARLLLAAAYASGFDIFELAERAGARMFAEGGTSGEYAGASLSWPSLNAGGGIDTGGGSDGGDSGIQVVYSPVIHTDNAEGMEQALMEDKRRLQKWFEEWWQKRKLYESVAAYK